MDGFWLIAFVVMWHGMYTRDPAPHFRVAITLLLGVVLILYALAAR